MAPSPKFNTPKTSPPSSGWQSGHRPPPAGYGQLDGNASRDDVSPAERAEWPACDPEGY